jgi:hypothetical protein
MCRRRPRRAGQRLSVSRPNICFYIVRVDTNEFPPGTCLFCKEKIEHVDYKYVATLLHA